MSSKGSCLRNYQSGHNYYYHGPRLKNDYDFFSHCTHTSHITHCTLTSHVTHTPHTLPLHTHTPHTVMRQSLPKVIEYTTEPKSAEVRRQSQKVLTRLFDLNPATLSLMLNALPRILQESANRILQGYVADMSSSGEESDREKSTTPKKTSPAQRKVWCVWCVVCVCVCVCGVWCVVCGRGHHV